MKDEDAMVKPFYPRDLASSGYRQTLQEMHALGPWGTKGYKHEDPIRVFYNSLFGCSTILDYGCGSNSLANTCKDLDIRSYDPGIPEFAEMPIPADLVVCIDVLEHVEPESIHNVIRHIAELAQIGIYLHIATKPAKQILPDGRNAHLIIEGLEQWTDKLATISDRWKIRDVMEGSKTLGFQLVRNDQ